MDLISREMVARRIVDSSLVQWRGWGGGEVSAELEVGRWI